MNNPPRPIEAWAANLILMGVNRLDCAITTLGCVMMDLDDDPENGDARTVAAIRWLYGVLSEEADNIRHGVAMAQDAATCVAKTLSVAGDVKFASDAPQVLEAA